MKFKYRFLVLLLLTVFASNAQSLVGVSVDDLSDAQISQILKRGASQGLSEAEGEAMALSMGLSPAEAAKFKQRVAQLKPVEEEGMSVGSSFAEGAIPSFNKRDSSIQRRIQDSSSIFGHQLFREADIKVYDRGSDAKAGPDYVLGAGDQISLTVYGTSYFQKIYTVDPQGSISMDGWGKVQVANLSFESVQKLLKSKIRPYFNFTSNEVAIALAYSRAITVNVVGEVAKPGSYTFPALNTAFNALVAAGGPTNSGTLRAIQIVRSGKVVATFDVYAFLFTPERVANVYLQDHDYIHVGPLRSVVSIQGEVRRPFKYEAKEGDSPMDLLAFAGGLTEGANVGAIEWYKKGLGGYQVQSAGVSSALLSSGDSIYVGTQSKELRSYVEINGGVESPGKYAFKEGITLAELLQQAGGLQPDALKNGLYLSRELYDKSRTFLILTQDNAGSQILQNKDKVHVIEVPEADAMPISVQGAVRTPLKTPFADGMTLGDALRLAGGLKNSADYSRVEVNRLGAFTDFRSGTSKDIYTTALMTSVPRELSRDLTAHDERLEFLLQPYDQIIVREIPEYQLQNMVYVGGEVQYPGLYVRLSKDEKISSLVERAGGLTTSGSSTQASLKRLNKDNIRLNLDGALKAPTSRANLTLLDGDTLVVPEKESLIAIEGPGTKFFVRNGQSSLHAPFEANRRATYYVKQFGLGFAKKADIKETYVSYPNGQFSKVRNFGLFRIHPIVRQGATIHTVIKDPKPEKRKAEPKALDWNQVVASLTSAAMGFGTVYTLLTR
ncbi:SLBB domain-containing protein [Schleiferiaceae bacterium]|nr:SLBB domain-containing protein [Schleiferiaceae bacterium]